MHHPDERGMLILETLIAIGIGAMFLTALAGMVLLQNSSADRAKEYAQATWYTQEGLDTLRATAFTDLVTSTSSPETLADGSTRVVKIEDVQRDASCNVVTSGGTVDEDSKLLTSTTTWTDAAGRSHAAMLSTLRTRWDDPQGSCFGATMATSISWAVEGAVWSGGKQLRNLWFTNTGGNAVTVDEISFTWTNGAMMSQLFMDTTKVWSTTGPGTPLHALVSGEEMDIADFTVPPGSSGELNKGQFDSNMTGVCLTMTVEFTDDSSWTSPTFCPP